MRRMKRVLALFLAVATVWTGMPLDAVWAQEIADEQNVTAQEVKDESEAVVQENEVEQSAAEDMTSEESTTEEDITQEAVPVNYVVIDSGYVTTPGTQKVVIGIGDDNTVIENAVLTYVNEETQERYTTQAAQSVGGAVLFSMDFAAGQAGVYSLEKLEYTVDGTVYTSDFSTNGMETKFGVDKEVETQPDAVVVEENEEETPVVITDLEGNETTGMSIEEAIDSVVKEKNNSEIDNNVKSKTYTNNGTFVVVLDPGHGGSDPGTVRMVNGVTYKERDINLKIAEYCKAELEQYSGIKVYLTRTDNSSPLMNRKERTDYAMSVGANVIVSIHINATDEETTSANGALVYCPNTDTQSGMISQELADRILSHLAALGLKNRGKVIDEELGMIKYPKEYGVPGILIEHAFINNEGDRQNYLSTDEQLNRLGVADATGIAEYFGLHKKGALEINGIFYSEKNEWIEAGVSWQSQSESVQFRWLAYDTAKGTWTTLSDWSKNDYITWRPGKGNYWLRVEAKTAEGAEADWTIVYESKKDFTKHYVDISGIYCLEDENGIRAGAVHNTTDTGAKFRWMVYDINKGTWTTISDWNKSEWVDWKPKKGNYWLRVEAKSSDGMESDYTIAYNPQRGYEGKYVEIDGIYCQEERYGIRAGAVHVTNDTGVKFRWMVYDINKGTWTTISDWNKSEWVTWTPKKGNYWLRVEAKTSDGKEENYTIAYNPSKSYSNYYVNVQGIYCEENANGIRAGAVHQTNDKETVYRWMVYDVNKGTWTTISDWNKSEWVNWKPEKGNYWLHVEARTREGGESSYTIAYNPARDYSRYYVELQGIYAEEKIDGIRAGAVHVTNDAEVKYRWMVYDVNKGTWTTISDWKKSEWVTWNPEAGDYWLRVEAKTSDGSVSDYTIAKRIERYSIMGKSSTNLSQMVAYYKKNAVYPAYYQSSDAPTIESFCQIYIEECAAEGVKAEVAFAQAMKETGFLRFGGQVDISQYNFAGIGATDGGAAGASFPNVRTGIRAQVQHLKAYASTENLKNPCVDPRFHLVKRGTAPYVEWLGQKENPLGYGWATAQNYGYSMKNDYICKLLAM